MLNAVPALRRRSAIYNNTAAIAVVVASVLTPALDGAPLAHASAFLAVPGEAPASDRALSSVAGEADKAGAIARTLAGGSALPYADLPYAETLYRDFCSTCHDGENTGAPSREALEMLSSSQIIDAMTRGVMAQQAARLPGFDKEILARYLAAKTDDARRRRHDMPRCEGELAYTEALVWDRWGGDPRNSRFRNNDKTAIRRGNVDQLKVKWVFGFPNASRARSQPAATREAIFTGSQDGTVYALDTDTGCIWWTFYADAEVRVAPILRSDQRGLPSELIFSDFNANVYAVRANTGELIWRASVKDHPVSTLTGSPSLFDDTLYVPMSSTEVVSAVNPQYECCTFRGGVAALDANTGKRRWTFNTVARPLPTRKNAAGTQLYGPSGAPVWSAPTIDAARGLLYFGTGENYSMPASDLSDAIVALHLSDGRIAWANQTLQGDTWNAACVYEERGKSGKSGKSEESGGINCPDIRGPDFDFGAPPILTTLANGQDIILAGQKSGMVYAMDPENNGRTLWAIRAGMGGYKGGIHWGMASDGETLFVGIADTPGHRQSVGPARSGIHAYDPATGELRWARLERGRCEEARMRCWAAASAPVTATDELVFVGGLDGVLRIHSSRSGELLWSYDTVRVYDTVNGVAAKGGSIDGSGPVLIDGKLILNSGYDKFREIPGNALIVFELAE